MSLDHLLLLIIIIIIIRPRFRGPYIYVIT